MAKIIERTIKKIEEGRTRLSLTNTALEALGLKNGSQVEITVYEDKIVIRKYEKDLHPSVK